jgi:CHAD domain-containing protein
MSDPFLDIVNERAVLRATIERLTRERDEAKKDAIRYANEVIEAVNAAHAAELAKAREALTLALPQLKDNALFLRDIQANAGKVANAFAAVEAVRAALKAAS